MQQVVTGSTENECFSPSGDHHPLPEGLTRFNVFKFPHMMDLKRPLCRFTVFTLAAIESANEFRAAERQCQRVRKDVNVVAV